MAQNHPLIIVCFMALYHYFKRPNTFVESHLPDPKGPLSSSLMSATIESANEAVLEVGSTKSKAHEERM